MANLSLANSGYSVGSTDTWTTQIDNVSLYAAQHVNGLASAILQIEAALGSGSALPGSLDSLVARLAVQVGSDGIIIPVGGMIEFAGSSAPTGWLFCDGSAVSRTTYASLFSAIGTTYGPGNSSTTFNLPDFRGRVAVGAGTGAGGDTTGSGVVTGGTALTARSIGQWFGADEHTMSLSELVPHTHPLAGHTTDGNSGNQFVSSGSNSGEVSIGTGSTGSGSAFNLHQASLVCNKIIKV